MVIAILLTRLQKHRHFNRAIEFCSKFAVFGSTQIAVMGLQFAVGIYIIRRLSVEDYALYTLANTVFGMMNVLADGGITSGVAAEGGKVWRDPHRLGGVLAAGFAIRRTLSSIAVAIFTPILVYLLLTHGASYTVVSLLVIILISSFLLSLRTSLLGVPLGLHQRISDISVIGFAASIIRSVLSLSAMTAIPSVATPLFANLFSQVWAAWQTGKRSACFFNRNSAADTNAQIAIADIVKRSLPGAIYFCFSGQITIWLLSTFGTATAIAQVGALGRLGQLLLILNTVFATLVLPRFSRCTAGRKALSRMAFMSIGGMAAACFGILVFVAVFPSSALYLLGTQYSSLTSEVVIAVAQSCVGLLSWVCYHLALTRGWILLPIVSIGITIVTQIIAAMLINVSDLRGALIYGLTVGSITLVMQLIHLTYRITRERSNDLML